MEYGQVVLWLGTLIGLSALGLPITSSVFATLPQRGAGFAPAVALGVVSIVAYWVGHLQFGPSALVAGLGVLVAGSAVAYRLGVDLDWRGFGEAMVLFGVAFCFVVAIRAVDPGLLPFVEDFLDYGMMKSILRASYLPPEDFWFAGTRVRYHYGGHLTAALETMLTGTQSAVAYNLALAGFYATLVAGAYELAGAIAAASGRSPRVAGLFGAYFVGVAGNVLVPLTGLLHVLPSSLGSPLVAVVADGLGDSAGSLVTRGLGAFDYWDAYGVIPDSFTPFPLLLALHSELHAPLTSAPFFLLVLGVWYAYYRTPESEPRRRRLLAFVVAPLVTGYTMVTDVWTAPTAMGVAWLALTFAPAPPETLLPDRVRTLPATLLGRMSAIPTSASGGGTVTDRVRLEVQRVGVALTLASVLAGVTIASMAPFVFGTVAGGKESVAFVPFHARSSLSALLLVHGAFLAIFALYLKTQVSVPTATASANVRWAGGLAVFGLAVIALVVQTPAIVLFLPLVAVSWYALRCETVGFETVLLLAGAGLVVLPEFVYVANQDYVIPGRGNTVFRVYMQTWLIWGTATGVVIPHLVAVPEISWPPPVRRQTVVTVFVVGLVGSTALYGGFAVFGHFDRAFKEPTTEGEQATYVYEATRMQDGPIPPTRPPTLNGLLYGEVTHPNETRAIKWLDHHVKGTPTLVTAPGGRWEWRSAAAALTGIPTVAGSGHELVYREWETYYGRVNDVRAIYTASPERRVDLLKKYDVRYVYVGPGERQRYDIWEFSLLDGVSVAYRNRGVTIYAVDQSELGYSPRMVKRLRVTPPSVQVDTTVTTRRDGQLLATGPNGTLAWWGPYVTLPPGKYVARFRLAANSTDQRPVIVLDVVRGGSTNGTADFGVLASEAVGNTDGVRTVSVPFTLSQPASDVEFRGRLAEGNATVTLYNITLHRIDESSNKSGKN